MPVVNHREPEQPEHLSATAYNKRQYLRTKWKCNSTENIQDQRYELVHFFSRTTLSIQEATYSTLFVVNPAMEIRELAVK